MSKENKSVGFTPWEQFTSRAQESFRKIRYLMKIVPYGWSAEYLGYIFTFAAQGIALYKVEESLLNQESGWHQVGSMVLSVGIGEAALIARKHALDNFKEKDAVSPPTHLRNIKRWFDQLGLD